MKQIIAIINQKGGVGKTTTALAMAAGLTAKKKRALLVDLDAQGNSTFGIGATRDKGATVLGLLLKEAKPEDAIIKTPYGDIIPSSNQLSGADGILTFTGKEYRLKEALEPLRSKYDYIIIDTPPALSVLTTNALTAAQAVIIPAQADAFSLQGIADLSFTINPVKKYCNPDLKIMGILLTRYNSRSRFNKELMEIAEEMAAKLETKVFKTKIREGVAVKKAQALQKSLFEAEPKANVTEDYKLFLQEITGKEYK